MVDQQAIDDEQIQDGFVHFEPRSTKISKSVTAIVDKIGSISSWLWLLTVATIISSVVLRYVFNSGLVILEELTWYLYGACWLMALSYAFVHDSHVRVTILQERFSQATKIWVDLIGSLFLLLPFLLIVFFISLPYFWDSFIAQEISMAPNGMPVRWLIKFFIPFSFFLLILVVLVRVHQCIADLRHIYQKHSKQAI